MFMFIYIYMIFQKKFLVLHNIQALFSLRICIELIVLAYIQIYEGTKIKKQQIGAFMFNGSRGNGQVSTVLIEHGTVRGQCDKTL